MVNDFSIKEQYHSDSNKQDRVIKVMIVKLYDTCQAKIL